LLGTRTLVSAVVLVNVIFGSLFFFFGCLAALRKNVGRLVAEERILEEVRGRSPRS